ncbi:MAG: sulfotransferase [Magnetococcales bacterium]|nr:sulfotransferase [Magnetococcales bacterium]
MRELPPGVDRSPSAPSSSPLPEACSSASMVPLFVVGCDRSGTTLLTSLIESGLGLAAPLETHFIPYFARTLFLWGNLKRPQARERLLMAILAFMEMLVARTYPGKGPEVVHPVTLLAVREEARTLAAGAEGFGGLIRGLFARYATLRGQRGWVDNSSFYESLSLELWQRHLPDLKVIHIVRDGRDVALSWLNAWWGPATLGEAAWLWSRHVRDKRAWGAIHPEAYLEIRYETLLTQPEETLKTITTFLGWPFEPGRTIDLSASPAARVLSTGGTHDLLSGPVRAENREKWRRAMTPEDQRFFEFVAGETLKSSGYPSEQQAFGLGESLRLWFRLLFSLLRRFVTPIYYAKKAKTWLPLVLKLVGPAGMERVVRRVCGPGR